MNDISCDVCLDLIPLVKDGVASDDSKILVENHINTCEQCKTFYLTQTEYIVDDKKAIKKIRKSLYISSIIILIIGCLLGSSFIDYPNYVYNFLLMPFLGALSYIIFNKKSFFVPPIIFVVSSLWNSIIDLIKYNFFSINIFFPIIYLIFAFLGILIAILLKFAFKKEDNV